MKNKAALIILAAIAIPLYLWDSHLLLSGFFGSKKTMSRQRQASSPLLWQPPFSGNRARFEMKGRSPFIPFKEKPNSIASPVTKKQSPAKPAPPPVPEPKIAVTGILWHPTNPVAIVTLPDNSSTTVKAGQTIGTLKFKTIEKTRVLVIVDGKEFWIAK